jgi:GTP-binding protein
MTNTPVIALIGRPNVGKSTLFNSLTKSKNAIVADFPGVTRDRQYGEGKVGSGSYWVIDTGGIENETHENFMPALTRAQINCALNESDLALFIVDAKDGINPDDEQIADELRRLNKEVIVIVNKTDGLDPAIATAEFYQLGFAEIIAISAQQGRNVKQMIEQVLQHCAEHNLGNLHMPEQVSGIKMACIGRPNAGKSTLVNRILGEERVIVSDVAGTTRDSIAIPFEHQGKKYTLIDTAGLRRRSKIKDELEQFSIVQSLRSIHVADVILMLLDARKEISAQDCQILSLIMDKGAALVVLVNKWDKMTAEAREEFTAEYKRKLGFVDCAKVIYISALHGTNVGHIYAAVRQAYKNQHQELSTNKLTELLKSATEQHQPPMRNSRRIKLRYAHIGGKRPYTIVIHGKQTDKLPPSYNRYLMGYFRKNINLEGVPLHIKMLSDDNPYDSKQK